MRIPVSSVPSLPRGKIFCPVTGCLAAIAAAVAHVGAADPVYVFSHLAGAPTDHRVAGYIDGSAAFARFWEPRGVAVDAEGNVYIADSVNSCIRKLSTFGTVTTLAGGDGWGANDGFGTAARFRYPGGLAVDGAGNVYVADTNNHTIRKITPLREVTTIAGDGVGGSADGPGIAARFSFPNAVAVDVAGNVYVVDAGNFTIRKIAVGGVVSTLAGTAGQSGAADGAGAAARFDTTSGIAVDPAGNLFVADTGNHALRKITPGGVVSTVSSAVLGPRGVAVDAAGTVYVTDAVTTTQGIGSFHYMVFKSVAGGPLAYLTGTSNQGVSINVDGPAGVAQFSTPWGIAADHLGNLYVADVNHHTIRRVDAVTGFVTTAAGAGPTEGAIDGVGAAARFNAPWGIAVDATGNTYVADVGNSVIRKITPAGVVSTHAGSFGAQAHVDGPIASAQFALPLGIAVDAPTGTIYVVDGHQIRKITPAGIVSTFAGASAEGSLDGVGTAARFRYPRGVAVDAAGNVYVAEEGNHTIRKITPAGQVTTLAGSAPLAGYVDGVGAAARFYDPYGVAVNTAGIVYVTERGNNTIRAITPSGVVTTLAGNATSAGYLDGTGTAARFNFPWGIAVTKSGQIFVVEAYNSTIRKITPDGVVTTVGGSPSYGGNVNGPGSEARFYFPSTVAVDDAERLYVADAGNDAIRLGVPVIPAPPVITQHPADRAIVAGNSAMFSVSAPGLLPLSYRWQRRAASGGAWEDLSESADASGVHTANLTVLVRTTSSMGDEFRCQIGNGFTPEVASTSATLDVAPASNVQLVNISTRAVAGAGADVQIAGFVITGAQPKEVLLRANGPALSTSFGLSGVLGDPALRLFDQTGAVLAQNSGWSSDPTAAMAIAAAAARVSAFPWTNGSADSALLVTLSPGLYTAQVTSVAGDAGIALVEVYDADLQSSGRLVNLSTRSVVQTAASVQIAGFVVRGDAPKTVLIRAGGPTLNHSFNLAGVLPDPVLTLFDAAHAVIAQNTGWTTDGGSAAAIKTAAARIGAYAWPDGSADSALLLTVAPGAYTAHVAGQSGGSGLVLIEVYDADLP